MQIGVYTANLFNILKSAIATICWYIYLQRALAGADKLQRVQHIECAGGTDLQLHINCSANTSAAILQHGIYCGSTVVWRRSTADPLVFCNTLTLFAGYIIITLNKASTCWRLLLSMDVSPNEAPVDRTDSRLTKAD